MAEAFSYNSEFKWSNPKIGLIIMRIFLFLYLVLHAEAQDKVIVYHSTGYGNAIYFAKKIKRFQVTLEVEEIYQDVKSLGKKRNRQEYRDLQQADAYIFSSELLNKKLNPAQKPYILIYGTYQVEEDQKESFNDDRIHIVYAGTFSKTKGGAASAVSAAEYLSENFWVHILGFGTDAEVRDMKQKISEMNSKIAATITYDGLLQGKEYISFMQKCQIGLSTQNPNAKFNNTSFPSKILSYMANGLRVVTVRIPVVEASAIGDDMYYYDKQEPKEIAEAIQSVDFKDGYDGRRKIQELDEKFKNDLKRLLLIK